MDEADAIVAGEVLRLERVDETWSEVSFRVESALVGLAEAQALVGTELQFLIPREWTYEAQPESVREIYGAEPPPVTGGALVDVGDEKALFMHEEDDRWLLTDRAGMWGWDGERVWPGDILQEGSLRGGGKKGEVSLTRSAAGVDGSIVLSELQRLWRRERSSRSEVYLSYLRWPTEN